MQRPVTFTIIIHCIAWLLFYALVIIDVSMSPDGGDVIKNLLSPYYLLFYFIFPALFYLNLRVLWPGFFLRKKYFFYFGSMLLLFAVVYWLQPFDHLIHRGEGPGPNSVNNIGAPAPNGHRRIDIISIVLFMLIWTFSTAVAIFHKWRSSEKRALQAETDKANAELSFLKAQVNPHFLFNTLNNIYSLAVTKDENTAPSIMKLSNIMRYIVDEAREDFVLLDNEIACMRDYIDLQRMRMSAAMTVNFSVSGNTINKKIAPLILMTFVENVFKYGTSSHEASAISIQLTADTHTITFFCQNKLFETKRNTERTGIGIANARQRLEYLYPGKYFLDVNTEKELFTVQLSLQA